MTQNNNNVLEPLVDSILESGVMMGTLTCKVLANTTLLACKGIGEVVKFVADVADIGYRCATGTYDYEVATDTEEVSAKLLTKNMNTMLNEIEEANKTDCLPVNDIEYLNLDESFLEDNTLPIKAKYRPNMNNNEWNTLKVYVGIEEGKKQHEIDFFKDGSLMIGGMSRWGKTSLILSIFTSACERYDSNYLRIVLVDFKRVDLPKLNRYSNLMNDCITDMKRFNDMLIGMEKLCEERSELFLKADVSNIIEFNDKSKAKLKPILIIIDEIGRIMNSFPKKADKEAFQVRLSSLISISMGFGIYFVVASQELSRDTLGKFKTNVGQSIGLHCQSKIESDQIIQDGELENIDIKGRCRHKSSEGITDFQSYYLEMEDIRTILKDKEKVD